MQTKLFEVRDRGTLIPVMAVNFSGGESPLLRWTGYGSNFYTIVTRLSDGTSANDPYNWSANPRTMREAHIAIEQQWNNLTDGQVIDVEYFLGETASPKKSDMI